MLDKLIQSRVEKESDQYTCNKTKWKQHKTFIHGFVISWFMRFLYWTSWVPGVAQAVIYISPERFLIRQHVI